MDDMDPDRELPPDSLSQSLSATLLPEQTRLETLLRRAKDGDQEAANQLWLAHQPRLELCVRHRLGPGLRQRAMLETLDIVQDTFAKAQQKLADVEILHRSSLLDWLARIAENRIHDYFDQVNAQKRNPPGGVQALDAPVDGSGSDLYRDPQASETLPGDRVERLELIEQVQETVAGLKTEWRDVIYFRSYLQLPWSEVAERMGIETVGAAKQLFVRAKLRLARDLPTSME